MNAGVKQEDAKKIIERLGCFYRQDTTLSEDAQREIDSIFESGWEALTQPIKGKKSLLLDMENLEKAFNLCFTPPDHGLINNQASIGKQHLYNKLQYLHNAMHCFEGEKAKASVHELFIETLKNQSEKDDFDAWVKKTESNAQGKINAIVRKALGFSLSEREGKEPEPLATKDFNELKKQVNGLTKQIGGLDDGAADVIFANALNVIAKSNATQNIYTAYFDEVDVALTSYAEKLPELLAKVSDKDYALTQFTTRSINPTESINLRLFNTQIDDHDLPHIFSDCFIATPLTEQVDMNRPSQSHLLVGIKRWLLNDLNVKFKRFSCEMLKHFKTDLTDRKEMLTHQDEPTGEASFKLLTLPKTKMGEDSDGQYVCARLANYHYFSRALFDAMNESNRNETRKKYGINLDIGGDNPQNLTLTTLAIQNHLLSEPSMPSRQHRQAFISHIKGVSIYLTQDEIDEVVTFLTNNPSLGYNAKRNFKALSGFSAAIERTVKAVKSAIESNHLHKDSFQGREQSKDPVNQLINEEIHRFEAANYVANCLHDEVFSHEKSIPFGVAQQEFFKRISKQAFLSAFQ